MGLGMLAMAERLLLMSWSEGLLMSWSEGLLPISAVSLMLLGITGGLWLLLGLSPGAQTTIRWKSHHLAHHFLLLQLLLLLHLNLLHHLGVVVGSSSDNCWAKGTVWQGTTGWGSSIPNLDSEVFLASLLEKI